MTARRGTDVAAIRTPVLDPARLSGPSCSSPIQAARAVDAPSTVSQKPRCHQRKPARPRGLGQLAQQRPAPEPPRLGSARRPGAQHLTSPTHHRSRP